MTDAEIKEKSKLCKGVTEFVMTIDRPFDKPILHTGALVNCMDIGTSISFGNYFFMNTFRFGPFINIDTIDEIRTAIIRSKMEKNDKILQSVMHNHPNITIVNVDKAITADMIRNPETGSYVVAINLFGVFKKYFGDKIDYRNFASRVHVRCTNTLAGLGTAKAIPLIRMNVAPHLVSAAADDNRYVLVDFVPERHELLVAKASNLLGDPISVDSAEFIFEDEKYSRGSAITENIVKMFGLYEAIQGENVKLMKRINELDPTPPPPKDPEPATATALQDKVNAPAPKVPPKTIGVVVSSTKPAPAKKKSSSRKTNKKK